MPRAAPSRCAQMGGTGSKPPFARPSFSDWLTRINAQLSVSLPPELQALVLSYAEGPRGRLFALRLMQRGNNHELVEWCPLPADAVSRADADPDDEGGHWAAVPVEGPPVFLRSKQYGPPIVMRSAVYLMAIPQETGLMTSLHLRDEPLGTARVTIVAHAVPHANALANGQMPTLIGCASENALYGCIPALRKWQRFSLSADPPTIRIASEDFSAVVSHCHGWTITPVQGAVLPLTPCATVRTAVGTDVVLIATAAGIQLFDPSAGTHRTDPIALFEERFMAAALIAARSHDLLRASGQVVRAAAMPAAASSSPSATTEVKRAAGTPASASIAADDVVIALGLQQVPSEHDPHTRLYRPALMWAPFPFTPDRPFSPMPIDDRAGPPPAVSHPSIVSPASASVAARLLTMTLRRGGGPPTLWWLSPCELLVACDPCNWTAAALQSGGLMAPSSSGGAPSAGDVARATWHVPSTLLFRFRFRAKQTTAQAQAQAQGGGTALLQLAAELLPMAFPANDPGDVQRTFFVL